MNVGGLRVQHLGLQPYKKIWQAMSDFTDSRDEHTPDELWLVQHSPVFTQGQAGKSEHILQSGDIPVVQTDRGGQVTYHGPGQLVLYPLINLRRRGLGVRDMVTLLEQVAIQLLSDYGIKAYAKPDAPGVYVQEGLKGSNNTSDSKGITGTTESKIASLGLRVRRGCCFHGMSINIDMDLSPFALINPCGYAGMKVTQLKDLLGHTEMDCQAIEQSVIKLFAKNLDVTKNDTI